MYRPSGLGFALRLKVNASLENESDECVEGAEECT
jgi:hypothetical protein